MNASKAACLIQQGKQTLSDYLPFWLVPTLVIGTLGSTYALRPPAHLASGSGDCLSVRRLSANWFPMVASIRPTPAKRLRKW